MSLLKSFSLNGETAIVTGAAQGLGKQMASGLAEMGADVAVIDVNHEKAAESAAELDGETDVITVEVNVTDEESVEAMVAAVTDRLGRSTCSSTTPASSRTRRPRRRRSTPGSASSRSR